MLNAIIILNTVALKNMKTGVIFGCMTGSLTYTATIRFKLARIIRLIYHWYLPNKIRLCHSYEKLWIISQIISCFESIYPCPSFAIKIYYEEIFTQFCKSKNERLAKIIIFTMESYKFFLNFCKTSYRFFFGKLFYGIRYVWM